MAKVRTKTLLEKMDEKLDLLLDELDAVDSNTRSNQSASAPERKRNINHERIEEKIGEVRWISVNELIQVWINSPFGKMKPPSEENFGTQSLLSLDSKYAALTEEQAQKIIDDTDVDSITWQEDKTDCDNIAQYMAALVAVEYEVNSVAIVDALDEGHSYCAFLLHDENGVYLRGFEPQTDEWRDDVEPKLGWIHFR